MRQQTAEQHWPSLLGGSHADSMLACNPDDITPEGQRDQVLLWQTDRRSAHAICFAFRFQPILQTTVSSAAASIELLARSCWDAGHHPCLRQYNGCSHRSSHDKVPQHALPLLQGHQQPLEWEGDHGC